MSINPMFFEHFSWSREGRPPGVHSSPLITRENPIVQALFGEKLKSNLSNVPVCPYEKLGAEECNSSIEGIFQHNFLWRIQEKTAEEK